MKMRLFGFAASGRTFFQQGTTPPRTEPVDPWLVEVEALCRAIEKEAKEKKMKKCHACGQKLPLKSGQFVEWVRAKRVSRGIVLEVNQSLTYASIVTVDGELVFSVPVTSLTRLHGYYRVTEREALR